MKLCEKLVSYELFGIIYVVINMIKTNDIIQEGNPILRKRSEEVALPLDDDDFKLLKDMRRYVIDSQDEELVEKNNLKPSVGLAAPQVGVNKKMFAMHTMDEKGKHLHSYAVVNPKIIAETEAETYLPGGEGCLSVDEEKNGLVPRAKRIKARVTLIDTDTGEPTTKTLRLSGYPGIVFQHEYDHLLGILFIDKKKPALPDTEPIEFNVPEQEL